MYLKEAATGIGIGENSISYRALEITGLAAASNAGLCIRYNNRRQFVPNNIQFFKTRLIPKLEQQPVRLYFIPIRSEILHRYLG